MTLSLPSVVLTANSPLCVIHPAAPRPKHSLFSQSPGITMTARKQMLGGAAAIIPKLGHWRSALAVLTGATAEVLGFPESSDMSAAVVSCTFH